jgi:hypothetical protein
LSDADPFQTYFAGRAQTYHEKESPRRSRTIGRNAASSRANGKAGWPRSSALPGRSLPKSPPSNIFTAALQYADTGGLLSCRRTVLVPVELAAKKSKQQVPSCGLAVVQPDERRSEGHPDFDTSTFEPPVTIPKSPAIKADVDTDPCLGWTPIAEQNRTTKAFRHASQSEVKKLRYVLLVVFPASIAF